MFTPDANTDLWILAGQSNMEGCGPLGGPQMACEGIWSFDMLYAWQPACDPLHHLNAATDPCHRKIQEAHLADMAEFDRVGRLGRAGAPINAGPGLSFAQELRKYLPGKTIALLPCAHGGTSLDEWMPEYVPPGERSEGDTLYGAMLKRLKATGMRPKGLLWYQGESDTTAELCGSYRDRFWRWVDLVRRDTGVPDLPIFIVQIATVAHWGNPPEFWEMVREQQRQSADPARGIYMTSALDGVLSDLIHIDAPTQRTLGRRLAHLALRHTYGMGQFPEGIQVTKVEYAIHQKNALSRVLRVTVRFNGVTGRLIAQGVPAGLGARVEPYPGFAVEWYNLQLNAAGVLTAELHLPETNPERVGVLYAPGLYPHCNITDEANQPLPAFGPVWLDVRKDTGVVPVTP